MPFVLKNWEIDFVFDTECMTNSALGKSSWTSSRVELKDLNKVMASYTTKLNKAKHRLEVIQADISRDLFNQDLSDQEKVTMLEIQKGIMVEEKVLRQYLELDG
ncbi:hypothetical protein H5410_015019 [Solanum commersonii]|uniref:Uncharacterized protein n=1 Tax=Solanum commersonii TaxID=4109 RepID=A0A9J5ZSW5_SOLCO|nr:hypothetical protein H5410_015019 [Solanum commersonii]